MTKSDFIKEVAKRNWKITELNADFRVQDCTEYYNLGFCGALVRVEKEEDYIEIIVTGEIRINTPNRTFLYKGGNPLGELTPHLKKKGVWENNNWFEINENGSSISDFEEVHYDLDSACIGLLQRIDKVSKEKMDIRREETISV